MYGLHVSLIRARLNNVFRGIFIKGTDISHIFYAEDVMLVLAWDLENMNHLIRILRCFFMALGLKLIC